MSGCQLRVSAKTRCWGPLFCLVKGHWLKQSVILNLRNPVPAFECEIIDTGRRPWTLLLSVHQHTFYTPVYDVVCVAAVLWKQLPAVGVPGPWHPYRCVHVSCTQRSRNGGFTFCTCVPCLKLLSWHLIVSSSCWVTVSLQFLSQCPVPVLCPVAAGLTAARCWNVCGLEF